MTPKSQALRQNVLYSVLDYVCQPAMMILAAPLLLRALGVQQYGTWMLVNAIAATASGLGGGFGDGATRYVSMYRAHADPVGVARSLIAVLSVNCAFGVVSAMAMTLLAPWLMGHAFPVQPDFRHVGVVALRISAVLLVVRFAEAVFTATLRGCQRYRPMIVVSLITRTAVVASTVLLGVSGHGLIAILWATLAIGIAGMLGQARLAFKTIDFGGVWREVRISDGVRAVFGFGAFTWVKSSLGVLIGYADRLLVGAMLGTGALAFYTLCNQLTQPIHALTAAAFNVVFPNLSSRSASGHWLETERSYRRAAVIAGLLVGGMSLALIVSAKLILRLWLGASFAAQYHNLLIAMAAGNALLALSVVPHYTALALGRSRSLALVNLVAGVASIGGGYLLIQRAGLIGAGFAKIVAGAAFLWLFNVAHRALRQLRQQSQSVGAMPSAFSVANLAQ